MAYRLYPDGQQELVRGIDISGTPLVALQSIRAASREIETFNGVCGAESGWVPVSASAPSLLLEKLEVEKGFIPPDRPPVLQPPAIRQGGAPMKRVICRRIRSRSLPRDRAREASAPDARALGPPSKAVTDRDRRRDRRGDEPRDAGARDPRRAEAVLDLLQDHRGRRERRRGEPRPDDDAQAQPPLRQPRGARARRQPELDNGNFVVPDGDEIDGTSAIEPAARGDAADRASAPRGSSPTAPTRRR